MVGRCSESMTHVFLHMLGDIEGKVRGTASRSPCDITEQGTKARHIFLALLKIGDPIGCLWREEFERVEHFSGGRPLVNEIDNLLRHW